jgi:16S rRNA (guanine527-N7)-methyltransferase
VEKNKFKEYLGKGLAYLEIPNTEKNSEQLWEYMHFLIEENQKYNLTAIEDPREIIIKHFLDSLALLKEERFLPGERVIDIGTGAGFPGLVLKLYQPEIQLVLVDSLSKRIGFLDELITRFELKDVQTIHGRAEDLGSDQNYRGSFNWVLSRAVAPVNILSEYTLPFAQTGGITVFYKGPDYLKELEEGKRAIHLLGGEIQKIKRINLPEMVEERYLLFIKKIGNTPAKYPRRAGIPKKRPL